MRVVFICFVVPRPRVASQFGSESRDIRIGSQKLDQKLDWAMICTNETILDSHSQRGRAVFSRGFDNARAGRARYCVGSSYTKRTGK